MQTKKLSQKQIFRTLVFQYHLKDVISLQLLAEVVSTLYYPKDPTGEIRTKYKLILLAFMKQFSNHEKSFTEDQFCKFMNQLSKHNHDEYTKKICERIFNRYRSEDKEAEGCIDWEGFKKLAVSFKLDEDELQKCFFNIANRKNLITFDRFLEHMKQLNSNAKK